VHGGQDSVGRRRRTKEKDSRFSKGLIRVYNIGNMKPRSQKSHRHTLRRHGTINKFSWDSVLIMMATFLLEVFKGEPFVPEDVEGWMLSMG
jgi:hypothetical protein